MRCQHADPDHGVDRRPRPARGRPGAAFRPHGKGTVKAPAVGVSFRLHFVRYGCTSIARQAVPLRFRKITGAMRASRWLRSRKCHEFEIALGEIALRQLRTRRSHKINMSRVVRPHSSCEKGDSGSRAGYPV